MAKRRIVTAVLGLIAVAVVFLGGLFVGSHTATKDDAPPATNRDFMFEVRNLPVRNQGGHVANLFFHYRYNAGIADGDLPDYLAMRQKAIDYLNTVDVSASPYWETLNSHLCVDLKNSFPIQAISCEMQLVGLDTPGPHYTPGYHGSVETIGDIEALSVPGPSTNP